MKIIGIAGGSGSGKSTVSYALVDENPDLFEVINLDDYQKARDEANLPMLGGMINWDHPNIIRWDNLIADIAKLKDDQPVTIDLWAHRSNPEYAKHHKMMRRTIEPQPVLIVEGYLALYNPALNKLFDKRYYFDLDDKTRAARRDKHEVINQEIYETKVLLPMHEKYIEPSRHNADVVLDVANMSVGEICERVKEDIVTDFLAR
jgi:uridine kinase